MSVKLDRIGLLKTEHNLSDCKGIQTYNHLVHKRTLNHLGKLAK